jgi:SAM-dependent methyltransferase
MTRAPVTVLRDESQEGRAFERLQAIVAASLPHEVPIRVLDAGCGRKRRLELPGAARVSGIDISPEALDLNDQLDEKIVGDVETYPLERESFDVVYCWDVLEHLSRPDKALRNVVQAMAPGGLLVLGLPNAMSLKGLATKLTPHRFHVWYYRRVLGSKTAGLPGRGPFKTFLRLSLSPSALAKFARTNGLDLLHLECYRSDPLPLAGLSPPARRIGSMTMSVLTNLVRALTAGRVDPARSEMVAVMRK